MRGTPLQYHVRVARANGRPTFTSITHDRIMPKFLNERQIGMDPTKIGFPNLGDCMAMVLVDEGGLFGFHLTRGDLSNAPLFVRYVQAHRNYTGHLMGLYAAANFKRRYGQSGGRGNWEEEMTAIAAAAGYTGQVNGYDLGDTGIKAPEAIYTEFRAQGSDCTVWYKRMSKIQTDSSGPNAPDDDVRELVPDRAAKVQLFKDGRGAEWDNNNPLRTISTNLGRGGTGDAKLAKVTRGNKGELHAAKSLIQFTV